MLAGALAAPVQSVYPGMGQGFVIISFVVLLIGGLGSMAAVLLRRPAGLFARG